MTREAVTNERVTDEEIARQITESIAWDTRIHYPHIRVTVDGGMVFLGGVVERLVEKNAAEEDAARLAGVTQVISNIVVQPNRPVTDGEVAEYIRRALKRDVRVRENDFEVSAQSGIVTLRGEVVTIMEKWAALDIAGLTYGVAGVIDQVKVLPADAASGHALEELVGAALARVAALDERRVHAHVEDSTVTLTGEVDFLYQKQQLERAVSDVPGVGELRSEIRVVA